MLTKLVAMKRIEYVEIEVGENGRPVEPTLCSNCSMSIKRQKCAFDMGGDCPRFDQMNVYNTALKNWIKKGSVE